MLESKYRTKIIFYSAYRQCRERVYCHCLDISDMDLCKLVCEAFHKEAYHYRMYYLCRENRVLYRLGEMLRNDYMTSDVKDYFEEYLKPWYDKDLSEGGPQTYNFLDANDSCKRATDFKTVMTDRNKSWVYRCGMFYVEIVEHKFDDKTGERVYTCNDVLRRICDKKKKN